MMKILLAAFLNFYLVSTLPTNPRSVNVALETSLLFQPGEESNVSFLHKIRNFIDQIEKAITPVKAFLRSTVDKKKIFSTFLEKLTHVLLKYDDKDLEETATILTNEVEKKLNNEVIFSDNTKKSILKILKEYCKVDANLIRDNLKNALNGNEIIVTILADKINSHFDGNDFVRLENLIEKTAKYAKVNNAKFDTKSDKAKTAEIKKIVKAFLAILKEKYDNLDEAIKIQANQDIGNLLQFFDVRKIYLNEDYKQDIKTDLKKKVFKTENENIREKNENGGTEKQFKLDDFDKNKLDIKSHDESTVSEH